MLVVFSGIFMEFFMKVMNEGKEEDEEWDIKLDVVGSP